MTDFATAPGVSSLLPVVSPHLIVVAAMRISVGHAMNAARDFGSAASPRFPPLFQKERRMKDGKEAKTGNPDRSGERAIAGLKKMFRGLRTIFLMFASASAFLMAMLAASGEQPELQRVQINALILCLLVLLSISSGWFLFWSKEMLDQYEKASGRGWGPTCWKAGKAGFAVVSALFLAVIFHGAIARFQETSDALKAFENRTLDRVAERACGLEGRHGP